jgi:O-acetyl-ADP-ribose deacetylase (regulator of RNase III)
MPIEVVESDITRLVVGAIVNAANETLLGGGGVDGAIHRAAGPKLLEACLRLTEVRPGVRCPTGEARITSGYQLAARYVIHTVGPVWRGGGAAESDKLRHCYRNSLRLARVHEVGSVAFPAISCGAYGYPLNDAVDIALQEIRAYQERESMPAQVLIAVVGSEVAAAYRARLSN